MPKSTMLLLFLLVTGCGAELPKASPAASPVGRNEPAAVAKVPVRERVDLALPRSSAFDEAQQVAQLRTAISLYTQFLERAGGRPELVPAVEKARQRIADAQQTIIFLESAPASD